MSDIFEAIKNSNNILLLTHENPDGDAVGSVLAMYHYLTSINKTVSVLLIGIPPIFDFLIGDIEVITSSNLQYDLAIVLDCATKERISQSNNEISRCNTSIVIDHHISNTKYGNINYVDIDTSSCCQILYEIFKKWNVVFTSEIVNALISGMLTDTGGFANSNINRNTFKMVYELYDNGVNFHSLYDKLISKKSMAQHNLMKRSMDRLEFFEDGKIAFSYITKSDFLDVGAQLGDHEGLVDIGRNIQGVSVSIFIREDGDYRVSFRSNGKIDVSKIAIRLGGGGHVDAAGTKINLSFEETKRIVIDETIKELND